MSIDIYSIVTDRIIEALEAGTVPWHKPWKDGGSRLTISHVTIRPYSLLNHLFLGVQPDE